MRAIRYTYAVTLTALLFAIAWMVALGISELAQVVDMWVTSLIEWVGNEFG